MVWRDNRLGSVSGIPCHNQLLLTYSSVSSVELLYLYHADWEHAVEEAEVRMRSDEVHHEFK